MEKESVKKFDLEAAFKALDEIEIPAIEKGSGRSKANRVDLKERFSHKPATETLVEDYYDVSSNEDLEEAKEEREGEVAQAKLARIEKIVDLDAETADDLLPSYVGKVIMQCPQCMTLFYKNPEDIEHSEENPDVVNINEVCQHCGNTSGYTLIGKVDSVGSDEADKYEEAPVEETPAEENELDLEFPEEETSEEPNEEDLDLDLDLDLEEVPEEEPEETNESLNAAEAAPSEEESENKSENVTLNEEVEDKDLDKKLAAHNEYIEYLRSSIAEKEEALKKAENEEIKALIEKSLEGLKADLEAALPDAVKEEPIEEIPATEEVVEEPTPEEAPVEEEEIPAEEPVEECVKEELTEETEEAPECKVVLSDKPEKEVFAGSKEDCEKIIEKNKDTETAKEHGLEIVEPAVEESLNTSEEAPSEFESEEKSENETLNESLTEGADAEIDAIIASWGDVSECLKEEVDEKNKASEETAVEDSEDADKVDKIMAKWGDDDTSSTEASKEEPSTKPKETEEPSEEDSSSNDEVDTVMAKWESLTEEPDLDKLLDSEEFRTPVSEEEIDAAKEAVKEEALEECNKQPLTEEPEDDAKAIIDGWEEPKEEAVEGYTGNPAERTTHLEYTDDDPTDGKAVLPDNIEKQLTEEDVAEEPAEETPIEEPEEAEEAPADEEPVEEEPQPIETTVEEVKEVATEVAEEVLEKTSEEASNEEVEEKIEEIVNEVVEDKLEEEKPEEGEAVEAEEEILTEGPINAIKNAKANKTLNKSYSKFIVKCFTKANPTKAEVKEFAKLQDAENYAKAFTSNPNNKEAWIYGDVAKKDNVLTGWAKGKRAVDLRQDTSKEINAVNKANKALDKANKKALNTEDTLVVPEDESETAEVERKEEPVEETGENTTAEVAEADGDIFADDADKKDGATKLTADDVLAALEAKYPGKKNNKIIVGMLKKAGIVENLDLAEITTICEAIDQLEAVEELNEDTFNSKLNEFLTEVYSNVKSFKATSCELTEGKLTIKGNINFNSGNEKLTVFEFLPNYGDGKLFFEGYNKDFADNNAFTLNFSINESKELITESFGYKFKINETLVEGLK